ncbi:MAG: hypothetical protein AMXMBFR58_02050 [Phycisphaerae bacterium]
MHACTIEPLVTPLADRDLASLAELLHDAVHSGAAVSFVLPFGIEDARQWWLRLLQSRDPRCIILVARDHTGITGSVQLHPSWAPNQPHRADIAKLLVHRRARRAGLGTRLMLAAEEHARNAGFTLLTLDAKAGGAAEALYRRLGWHYVGTIPRYALDPDTRHYHGTVIFYKDVAGASSPSA